MLKNIIKRDKEMFYECTVAKFNYGHSIKVYLFQDDVEKTEIMLEAIFSWANQKMRHDIRIYHLNDLFNTISQKLSEERRFPRSGGSVFATTQLETDKFTFSPSKFYYILYPNKLGI